MKNLQSNLIIAMLCALLWWAGCLPGNAQSHSEAPARTLPSSFHQWLSTPAMKHATVALEIVLLPRSQSAGEPDAAHPAIDQGRVLYAYDAERMVAPASVLKLVTAATGFRLLGSDYVWPDSIALIDTTAVPFPGLERYDTDWLIEDIDTDYMPPFDNLLPDSGRVLVDVARDMLFQSLNLQAETLLSLISPVHHRDSAILLVQDYWSRRGIDVSGLVMYDGSGLSPNDRVTAHFVNSVLADMQFDSEYRQSIALAGSQGTVRNFLKGTRLDGRARLKTGTLKNVVAYAGYVTGSDSRTYAVSLLVSNSTCKHADLRKAIQKQLLSLIP